MMKVIQVDELYGGMAGGYVEGEGFGEARLARRINTGHPQHEGPAMLPARGDIAPDDREELLWLLRLPNADMHHRQPCEYANSCTYAGALSSNTTGNSPHSPVFCVAPGSSFAGFGPI